MKITARAIVFVAALSGGLAAQEPKPVPKDSLRVSIPGCAKGYVFTAGRRSLDEAGSADVPEGMRFRLNGPKKMMAEIKAHEGSPIVITGLTKKGQFAPGGVAVGGGVRVGPGPGSPGGSPVGNTFASQLFIDLEGWRAIAGECPTR